jgi:hypothetical protein
VFILVSRSRNQFAPIPSDKFGTVSRAPWPFLVLWLSLTEETANDHPIQNLDNQTQLQAKESQDGVCADGSCSQNHQARFDDQ